MHEPICGETERIAAEVIGAAIRVHTALGPGLLESVYEACLCHELTRQGLRFQRQVTVPVVYEGIRLETGLRLDLVVEGCVVVELKAVEKLVSIHDAQILTYHDAQILTYLKLAGIRVGLLMNFNVVRLKEGLRRFVR
jgi:GxxExxY protein